MIFKMNNQNNAKQTYGIFEDFPERCSNPKYNGSNITNRLLVEQAPQIKQRKKIVYFCPAYLRIKIKNFSELSYEDLKAQVNSVIILTVSFNGITPLLQQKIRQLIKLGFNRDDSLRIRQTSKAIMIDSNKEGVYTYTIQKSVHVAMNPTKIFMSPFEVISLIMSIEIKDIQINEKQIEDIRTFGKLLIRDIKSRSSQYTDNKQLIKQQQTLIQTIENQNKFLEKIGTVEVKFNLMDTDLAFMKMSYNSEGSFGVYNLAESYLHAQYTNESAPLKVREKYLKRIKKFKQNNKEQQASEINIHQIDHSLLKPFHYAHFEIPLYKAPAVTLSTIFLPLWLLAVLTLGIYFQDPGLADRIGSLSGLQIAFIALIPVIRSQLPQSPKVTLVQFLVYGQIFTGILCFIQSLDVRNQSSDFQFIWQTNWLFLVSAAVLGLQILVIFILMIVHKVYWQRDYNKAVIPLDFKFNRLKWQNPQCDNHFQRKIDSRTVKVAVINPTIEQMKDKIYKLSQEQIERYTKQLQQQLQKVQIQQGSKQPKQKQKKPK